MRARDCAPDRRPPGATSPVTATSSTSCISAKSWPIPWPASPRGPGRNVKSCKPRAGKHARIQRLSTESRLGGRSGSACPVLAASGRYARRWKTSATTCLLIDVSLGELQRPLSNRLIRDEDSATGHQLIDVAKTQRKSEVEAYDMADDLGRVTEAAVKFEIFDPATLQNFAGCDKLTVPPKACKKFENNFKKHYLLR